MEGRKRKGSTYTLRTVGVSIKPMNQEYCTQLIGLPPRDYDTTNLQRLRAYIEFLSRMSHAKCLRYVIVSSLHSSSAIAGCSMSVIENLH